MAESKTFMDFLAADSVHGKELMGVDQAGRQADQRMQDRRERDEKMRQGGVYAYSSPTPAEMQQNAEDAESQQKLRQRRTQGGALFDREDTMC